MAIANLHETLLSYKLRKNFLNLELSELASQKTLAIRAQSDNQSLLSSRKHEIRDYFKALYEGDPELHEKYLDYTKIPEFEEEELTDKELDCIIRYIPDDEIGYVIEPVIRD